MNVNSLGIIFFQQRFLKKWLFRLESVIEVCNCVVIKLRTTTSKRLIQLQDRDWRQRTQHQSRLAAKHAVPAQSPSELRCETSRLMSALMECRVRRAAGSQVATVGKPCSQLYLQPCAQADNVSSMLRPDVNPPSTSRLKTPLRFITVHSINRRDCSTQIWTLSNQLKNLAPSNLKRFQVIQRAS